MLREMYETKKNIKEEWGEMAGGAVCVPVNKLTYIWRVKCSSIRPASHAFAWGT